MSWRKKRNDEIKRLLKLFDENNDKALQYAIPLDSPYLKRGSQNSSSNLTRNPLQFNLGKLGGGGVVEGWDIGDYYHDLRTKYLQSAQREIEQKDFKKAAYIYAHLLGDYRSAANVLEQGNMYREAAALYKDHLKNTASAAECLERGGLYVEAIELYKDLNKDEKIGDLYKKLEQPVNAEQYYEKHITSRLSSNDHLDAARVVDTKMNQTGRAKQILLEGWKGSYLAETCLRGYFDTVERTTPANMENEVKEVFTKHTPQHKRVPLLDVLEHVNKKKNEASLTNTVQDIAFDIVHSEAEIGNKGILNQLKRFFPADRLIGSDSSRYINSGSSNTYSTKTSDVFYLDQSIFWLKATWHRNQFLAVGIKNGLLHMVRGNWYNNLEYYCWDNPVKPHTRFTFINSPYYSNTVLLHASDGFPVTRKNLQKNKYFNEALVVYCPVWMHKGTAQCIIDEDKNICRLDIADSNMTLHVYTIDGDLKKSVDCKYEDGQVPGSVASHPYLVGHKNYYYTYRDKQFLTISETGVVRSYDFNTIIRFFASSDLFDAFYVVVSTNKGCFLLKPFMGLLDMAEERIFAEDLIPSFITFIAGNKFVIIERTKAVLFEIIDGRASLFKIFSTHATIVAVLPTSLRGQFALLEDTGRVTLCDI